MLDFDIQLPRNLLRYQHHVTLPPPSVIPSSCSLRQSHYAPSPKRRIPLARSPEGCCSRLGGDPRCDRGGSAREPTRGPVGGDPPHPVYRPWDPRENPRRAILFSTDFGSSSPPRASWHGAALFPLCPSLPTYLPTYLLQSVRSLERLRRYPPRCAIASTPPEVDGVTRVPVGVATAFSADPSNRSIARSWRHSARILADFVARHFRDVDVILWEGNFLWCRCVGSDPYPLKSPNPQSRLEDLGFRIRGESPMNGLDPSRSVVDCKMNCGKSKSDWY